MTFISNKETNKQTTKTQLSFTTVQPIIIKKYMQLQHHVYLRICKINNMNTKAARAAI